VSDEPYRRLCFGGARPPSVLRATRRSIVCSSFSKDLGLAGERIGFLAVHPEHPERDRIIAAATFANRVLGFVNAPALLQRAVARAIDARVDVGEYEARARMLARGLGDAGWDCPMPDGGLFVFPRAPIDDDVRFAKHLARRHKVLVVPGAGFGAPGWLRLSIAVPRATIERALPPLAAARKEALEGDLEG
jgi:aspartate aminotransferase